MNPIFKKAVLAAALSVVVTGPVMARDDTKGFLRGHIVGDQGVLSGATVTITSIDKGDSRTVKTDADGNYRIPALNSGEYTIKVTQDGTVLASQTNIYVGIGGKTIHNIDLTSAIEEISVVAQQKNLDTSSAVKDFVVNTEELLARVPVARDLTSVAMLAPSAHEADNSFSAGNHDAPALSLGGASIAENACFINGLNTTNFRNGLGCSQVPFEFYEQIQVKNGGYNAEFGRSIGGVMNATTKSGGNEFDSGISLYWEPDSLRGNTPNTYARQNSELENDSTNFNYWVSGPIVEDKLFFYALYSPSEREYTYESSGQINESEWSDEFWGLKLDYIIAEGHTLEYTGFDDTRVEVEDTYEYDNGKGDYVGTTTYTRGGENHGIKYTGVLTDWLTLNAQYGINKYNRTDTSTTDVNPVVYDRRSGTTKILGGWTNSIPTEGFDERKAYRLDVDIFLGDHNIRVGVDYEENTAEDEHYYSGHVRYDYYTASSTNSFVASGDLAAGDTYVRVRNLESAGAFETKTTAFYIQDEWSVTDQLTLHMGVRHEEFDNRNAAGDTFIELDDQWAPRLGVSFDPTGDESSRIYANYGRYYLPIAANTNIRLAGAEFFTEHYYPLQGLNGDDTPVFNPGDLMKTTILGDGSVPDVREILDTTIDPMYQDEYIIGYDWNAFEDWRFGVRYVYRELKSTIEDVAIDAGLNKYVLENYGIADFAGGFDYYVLTNPGSSLKFSTDVDGDGILDPITLSASQLGYPEATRDYKALEFTFERMWDGQWMLGGSLVLSKTKGNHEGYVKSDNGQDDAGLTTSFDQPGFSDGSSGYLPNDRRWTVKAWGSYMFDNGIMLGANVTARDGRPINCIGNHPTDVFAQAYGSESFYCNGEVQRRGTAGRTPDIYNIDVSAQYTYEMQNESEIILRADVFNIFDWDRETEVRELGELDFGDVDPNYKKPSYFQSPRRVRFSATYHY